MQFLLQLHCNTSFNSIKAVDFCVCCEQWAASEISKILKIFNFRWGRGGWGRGAQPAQKSARDYFPVDFTWCSGMLTHSSIVTNHCIRCKCTCLTCTVVDVPTNGLGSTRIHGFRISGTRGSSGNHGFHTIVISVAAGRVLRQIQCNTYLINVFAPYTMSYNPRGTVQHVETCDLVDLRKCENPARRSRRS